MSGPAARLFRAEALEGQRQTWLGPIQLIRPLSLSVLTCTAVAIAVAVAAFLAWGQYTRRSTVSGVLMPERGVLRLVASQSGTVLESLVREGQAVQRGQVMFVLAVGQASEQGDTQSAVASSLGTRARSLMDAARQTQALQDAQRAGLQRQRDELALELEQLGAERALQAQRLALAEQALARLESLKGDNFISAAQVQAKAEDKLAVQAQLQSLDRQRVAKQREASAVDAQLRELPLRGQSRQGEIERDLAEVAQATAENASRQRLVVRAPESGVVSAMSAQVGQTVGPTTALASVVPEQTTLQAQLYAPSSAVGFIRPNQAVRLRYQAFPHQKFGHHGGTVLRVSRTPLQASELAELPLNVKGVVASGEPLYRITVALDAQTVQAYGEAQPLAPGMQIDADVMLDRRRLIEWIFEPLISVTGRL